MDLDFSSSAVLVTGDVMLDRYWCGDSTRISPEAPVPVILVKEIHATAGGAANVALNAAHLGAQVRLISLIGHDAAGTDLANMLQRSPVQCTFVRDPCIQTAVKLRVLARGQQLIRADFEQPPMHDGLNPLIAEFENQLSECGVVVLSDYGRVGPAYAQRLIAMAREQRKPVLIDPKGSDYSAYRGATMLTPNRDEFAEVAGRWRTEAEFERKAADLCERLALMALLVTRSEEGMSLFWAGRHIPISTRAREVYDVSGASDTVIATLAAALGAGFDLEYSARLANHAASIVVAKSGMASITLNELDRDAPDRISSAQALIESCSSRIHGYFASNTVER
jgi:rfaE bifunctional protein kinase chain/domain